MKRCQQTYIVCFDETIIKKSSPNVKRGLRYSLFPFQIKYRETEGVKDLDSHAKRFDNRIIRSSTRLAEYSDDEKSDYYKDKIIPTDKALNILNIKTPEFIEYNGKKYVKSVNGYIREEYKNNKDVKRGLYMLSIPSNFVSKINLCEFGHVFKERNQDGNANPEVKEWAESVMQKITNLHKQITRDYVLSIEN